MLGATIATRALGDAGRRGLPTELAGPRPGGVRGDETIKETAEVRVATARKP
jgi:hypothetical protein